MELKEYTSKHLSVPFVIITKSDGTKGYLCSNGVFFTKEEYLKGIDLEKEYARREKEDKLYDYAYAKNTGILRKKRGTNKNNIQSPSARQSEEQRIEEPSESGKTIQTGPVKRGMDSAKSVMLIVVLLGFTSIISMYISTLHTATYLTDYVDLISAWLMSASVTAYNSTAFEVSVLFHNKKRNFMAVIFMLLWVFVTIFSMATTVSVFYDSFNFTESQIAEENKADDSKRLALSVLQKKEESLREAIEFKKKDIEYRQSKEYATSAVRQELTKLENELQENLSSQQKILEESPDASKKESEVHRKESFFSFVGRTFHLNGSVLEFVMSVLSAIFINLIAPLSVTAVIELKGKDKEKGLVKLF